MISISSLPELAAFAGVRIEAGDREARLGDPEIALQPAQRGPAARFDQAAGQRAPATSASGTWVVTGTVRRVGPASIIATLPRRHAAALGDEFGLAGMLEADRVELFLGHRAGDHRRSRARAGQPDRDLERSRASNARRRRSGWPGLIGLRGCKLDAAAGRDRTPRRPVAGRRPSRSGRPTPPRSSADRRSRRTAASPNSRAIVPAFGDDFGPDPGGIAERNGERRRRQLKPSPRP